MTGRNAAPTSIHRENYGAAAGGNGRYPQQPSSRAFNLWNETSVFASSAVHPSGSRSHRIGDGARGAVTLSPATLQRALGALRAGDAVLVHDDPSGQQHVTTLSNSREAFTIGRSSANDLRMPWDPEVSRAHCRVVQFGGQWLVEDFGLSRNGTFVNGERVNGQRWLDDRDRLTVGETSLLFRAPSTATCAGTVASGARPDASSLTPAQRRVLDALCRPLAEHGGRGAPATNRQIADELCLSVDTVKDHLRAIAHLFELDHLGQNERRLAVAQFALRWAMVG